MLKHISLKDVLCIDIETVPQFPSFQVASEQAQESWKHKSAFLRHNTDDNAVSLYSRAGIYAEFGKIICISTGSFAEQNGMHYCINSFYGNDEEELLNDFASFLAEKGNEVILCAHNGKEFDFPYLCRRMIVNSITLPYALQLAGKKPWEINHIDTMELWKFGDYKHYTPLKLLAEILGIESPKDDIDGSDVHAVYWEDKDLDRIVKYCEKDVMTVMKILVKMKMN